MSVLQHTKETGGNPDYYDEYTLTNLYVEKVFGGYLSTINITNDSTTETTSFSYDGATLAGEVKPGESVTINVDQRSSIYIKGSVGSDTARIWGWAGMSNTAAGATVAVSSMPEVNVNVQAGDGTDITETGGALDVNVASGTITSNPDSSDIDTGNSTTDVLGSGAAFTGTGADLDGYSNITCQLDSSHNSATDGMTFQFSTDDSNWDDVYTFTYTAANGARRFQFPVTAQYFRIAYTNGGTLQTHFRVQTLLHRTGIITSIHRLEDDMSPDRSAQVQKSVIFAQKAGAGNFTAINSTNAGNLKISVQEISDGLDIGAGNAGSETQRVSISTDDVNLAAINADTTTIAGDTTSIDGKTPALGQATKANSVPVTLASDEDTLTVDLGANNDVVAAGDVAHDTADSGNPVKVGGINTATPDITDNGDRGDAWQDLYGARAVVLVNPHAGSVMSTANGATRITGDVAHSGADAGNPAKLGHNTIAHGTNPTAVTADYVSDWYANRAGVPWVMGGHPNIITREYYTTAVQTNDPIIDSIGAGAKIVVTLIDAICDNANTVDVKVRIGFGTASVPAEPASGASVAGVVLAHSGIAPGSGVVRGSGAGMVGVGADGEELRITNEVPTGGSLKVTVSYYTVDS